MIQISSHGSAVLKVFILMLVLTVVHETNEQNPGLLQGCSLHWRQTVHRTTSMLRGSLIEMSMVSIFQRQQRQNIPSCCVIGWLNVS